MTPGPSAPTHHIMVHQADDARALEGRLSAFATRIERFRAFSDPEDNARARAALQDRLDAVRSLASPAAHRALTEQVQGALEAANALSLAGPVQAYVFYFGTAHGEAYLAGYGPVRPQTLAAPGVGLPLVDRLNNCVFEEVGPITIPGLLEARDEMPSEVGDTFEELDLSGEEDELSSLFALQSFCMLQEAFREAYHPRRLSAHDRLSPCLFYAQEHDGGLSALLLVEA